MRIDTLVFRIAAGALILGALAHVGSVVPRVIGLAEVLPSGWIVARRDVRGVGRDRAAGVRDRP
ncbi:MAG: hypothetical protein L0271_04180, partial [Gemmatimonadetes bacterium]|nr:hypothetical protein [Gemmatimonadota bacterium]